MGNDVFVMKISNIEDNIIGRSEWACQYRQNSGATGGNGYLLSHSSEYERN
ncbi:hypothetical protein KATP_12850 [Kluyvera ascorbata]|nr:hypothetical protein KATP_12850 [Kluyvera ascorbata]